MKENYGKLVLGAALIIAAMLIGAACISYAPRTHHEPHCPVCDEHSPTEEHLNSHCATNFEPEEEDYLCSKYYEALEEPVLDGSWGDPETGSFDFLLEEVDPLIASKCLTCGIHFTHPSYGEHIKTCCP